MKKEKDENKDIMLYEFEPKTKNRFIIEMEDIPAFVMKAIRRPHVINQDGKYIWSELEIEFYDPITPSTSQHMYSFIKDNKTRFETINVQCLGPVGDTVEQWKYKGCVVQSIEFGRLDWAKTEPSTIVVIFTIEDVILDF